MGATNGSINTLDSNGNVVSPATADKQDTGNSSLSSIDSKITAVNTGAVVVSSSALPSGASTEATLSSVNTALTNTTITGPAGQASTVNNILTGSSSATATSGYQSISIQITSTATSGTIIFEGSNDNSTFVTMSVADATTAGATAPIGSYTPANSTRIWQAPLNVNYFRVRISSTLSGGSVQAIAKLSVNPYASLANVVQQNTAGSMQCTATLATGANTIGALTANQSVNVAQVNGGTVVASVTGVQDVMDRKRSGSTGLSPNYSASHITTKTTTTPTSATAYVSTVIISCSAAGTSWTLKIQDKQGTPLILVPSFTLALPTNLPLVLQFEEPIIMTSGIDIITAGTTAGTVDVFITYWQ